MRAPLTVESKGRPRRALRVRPHFFEGIEEIEECVNDLPRISTDRSSHKSCKNALLSGEHALYQKSLVANKDQRRRSVNNIIFVWRAGGATIGK